MPRKKIPHFKFYYEDFEGGTKTMSNELVGAYIRLLIAIYDEGGAIESAHRDLLADMRSTNAVFDEQISAIKSALTKLEQMEYRMAQIEKSYDTVDTRISRINESYSNQFADFRTQLSSISTQIALSQQTLQRIEAASPTTNR